MGVPLVDIAFEHTNVCNNVLRPDAKSAGSEKKASLQAPLCLCLPAVCACFAYMTASAWLLLGTEASFTRFNGSNFPFPRFTQICDFSCSFWIVKDWMGAIDMHRCLTEHVGEPRWTIG